MNELDQIKKNAGLTESVTYDNGDVESLVDLVIDLNLTLPLNIDSGINRKMNAIEDQLKEMGFNPRQKSYNQNRNAGTGEFGSEYVQSDHMLGGRYNT